MSRTPLTGNGAWALGGRAGTILSGLAANSLLAHLLRRSEMGDYLLLSSLVTAAASCAQMGLGQAVVSRVASALALGQTGQSAAEARAVFRGGLCGAGVMALLLPLLLAFGGPAGRFAHFPGETTACLCLIGLWLAAQATQTLLAETFRGFHRLRQASLFGGLLTNLLLMASLAVMMAAHKRAGLETALALGTTSGLAMTTLGLSALNRLLRTFPGDTPQPRLSGLLASALPFWVTQVTLLVITNADLWVLGAFRPRGEVALYGVAARAAVLISLPLQISNAAVAPIIPGLYVRNQRGELGRMLRHVAGLGTLAALAGLALAACLGGPFLGRVFGPDYGPGGPVLAILAAGQFVNVAAGACGLTLMMTGFQKTMMTITLLCGLIAVAGDLLVVRPYGVTGVAAVASSVLVFQNAWMLLAAKHKTGLWTCAARPRTIPSCEPR